MPWRSRDILRIRCPLLNTIGVAVRVTTGIAAVRRGSPASQSITSGRRSGSPVWPAETEACQGPVARAGSQVQR